MAAQRTILPPLVLPADAGFVAITEEQWRRYVAPKLSDRHGELETATIHARIRGAAQ